MVEVPFKVDKVEQVLAVCSRTPYFCISQSRGKQKV